jgi:hypothetical protein
MNKSDVFVSVSNISVRKIDGKYSLYKPLLLLYVLSEYYSGKERLIQFSILNEQLSEIVNQYFANTKYLNFHYAFGRLENDGICEVENSSNLKRSDSGDLIKSELFDKKIFGGFTEKIFQALRSDKPLLVSIANHLLKHYFPKEQHSGRVFRTSSRWSQFVTLAMAQLAGRKSLRDTVEKVSAQAHRLYHLGNAKLTRSNLSRINENKPYTLYESLTEKLLGRCQGMTPGHNFRFKNPLYSLDASTIDLCLSVFPWAKFRTTKSAVKLHVGLNHDGYLPEFVSITDGKTSDIEMGRALQFPQGSIVAID